MTYTLSQPFFTRIPANHARCRSDRQGRNRDFASYPRQMPRLHAGGHGVERVYWLRLPSHHRQSLRSRHTLSMPTLIRTRHHSQHHTHRLPSPRPDSFSIAQTLSSLRHTMHATLPRHPSRRRHLMSDPSHPSAPDRHLTLTSLSLTRPPHTAQTTTPDTRPSQTDTPQTPHLVTITIPDRRARHLSLGPHRSLTTPLLPDFLPHPPPEQRPQHESAQMP